MLFRSSGNAVFATYRVTDQYGASSTSTLTIAVQGVNDSATISGNTYGSVAEDGVLSAAGVVTVSDADTGQSRFQTPASLAGVYGTFTFDASNGVWGYSLDNLAANVQALGAGDVVHDKLTVNSLDGTASQTIDVTINGADEAAPGPLDLDVFVTGHLGSSGSSPNVILVNQGGVQGGVEGQFATVPAGVADALYNNDVGLGDFDQDGDLDAMVVRANWLSGDNVLLMNQGHAQGGTEGYFIAYPTPGYLAESSNTWHFALGDLNGDGGLDAYLATWQGTADQILFNRARAEQV